MARTSVALRTTATLKSAPVDDDVDIVLLQTEPVFGLQIGHHHQSGSFFHGVIDEVRISDCVRYRERFEPPARHETDENTLALYHFDQGQGGTLIDASGNENHAVIRGASWVNADGTEIDLGSGESLNESPSEAPNPEQ